MFLNTQTDFANALPVEMAALMRPADTKLSGFVTGTKVETAFGWRAVETLTRGDAVHTLDGGLRVAQQVNRRTLSVDRALHVPGGVLGNCADMVLMPGQGVLIETDLAEGAFGAPMVLVPAAALAGFRGISWVSLAHRNTKALEVIELGFAEEEVVFAESGVLLGCYGAEADTGKRSYYKHLTLDQGQALIGLLIHGSPFDLAA
ncbi:Hint domain-containing protein [Aliiroseovarius sp. CAU 1755]